MNPRTHFTPLNRAESGHVLRIAHRGASAYAQENSAESFEKASAMGADMVEIDIRLTADGLPVVSHDESLTRLFGLSTNIADLTFAQLQAAIPTGRAPILTFEAVAAVCADLKLGLYLDIKEFNPASGEMVFAALDHFSLTEHSIAGSFRPDFAANIKAAHPRLRTSILYGSTHIDPVLLAQAIGADYVHPCWENTTPEPHRLLTPEWMEKVRAANLGIVCWHEERPSEITALDALGVDAICSDTPDILFNLTKS
ncbi:MAG: glycerophosphodiester phosphodiesterase [Chloroflexota bacterium]